MLCLRLAASPSAAQGSQRLLPTILALLARPRTAAPRSGRSTLVGATPGLSFFSARSAAMGRSGTQPGSAAGAQPATPPPPAPLLAAGSPAPAGRRRSGRVPTAAGLAVEVVEGSTAAPRTKRRRASAESTTAADEAVEPAVPLAADDPSAAAAAAEDALPAEARAGRRRARNRSAAAAAVAAAAAGGEGEGDAAAAEEGAQAEAPPKQRGGRRREPDPVPIRELPSTELLERLRASGYRPPPLPVPNLGYACLNTVLRDLKPPVFTSRDCIKKTLDAKGPPHLAALALANCRDLAALIQWNHEHGIRLFRMSSVLFPWMGTYDLASLPQFDEISAALRLAGDLARAYGQRLTFHPSHFVKLAAPDAELAAKSMRELEAHSQVFDLMGYLPASPENKINIHIGGVYTGHGSKEDTMRRWAANFARLSPNCRARITVENDDVASAFSLRDLLFLHGLTRVPLVFDFHHHKFCTGGLSERQAFEAALATWPPGVRPVVHWSESQEGRKPHAHSDYCRGPLTLHGREGEVDVMVEAKAKEQALLVLRGDIPYPEAPAAASDEAEVDD